ncbi:MAG: inositol monophosphatase family protein [Planctomycetota bacterium]|jgi:fructose-1,6-bisphosphatase/inositol monophosphatase family enzyme
MDNSVPELLAFVRKTVKQTAREVKEIVLSGAYYKDHASRDYAGANAHHAAPKLDETAQARVLQACCDRWPSFVLVSEELDGHILTHADDPNAPWFVADPLDGSAYARRRMWPASVSLCAYSKEEMRPLSSAVADIFMGITYFSSDGVAGAWCELPDGQVWQISTSGREDLTNASVSSLGFARDRFQRLQTQTKLIETVATFFNTGGALDICKVAAGDIDANIECVKGFRVWDIMAAGQILTKAGGRFGKPNGVFPEVEEPYRKRIPFIAAATDGLFRQIQNIVHWPCEKDV